jgi:alcohol dehydrogenase
MIARARGARVIGIDPDPAARSIAQSLGAIVFDGVEAAGLASALRDTTGGGPHLSIDAVGHPGAVAASVQSLRPRGRHVQIGLLPANQIIVPMGTVISRELEISGSHGMQAHRYPEMLEMVLDGRLRPEDLITKTIPLSEIPRALPAMGDGRVSGVTVVEEMSV